MPANILLVDDEPGIRGLIQCILESSGHTVTIAESAAQARSAATRLSFDLLLTDIVMPGEDGIELARTVQSTFPHTRVLLMTGFDNGLLALERDWILMRKPFHPSELLARVDELVCSSRPR